MLAYHAAASFSFNSIYRIKALISKSNNSKSHNSKSHSIRFQSRFWFHESIEPKHSVIQLNLNIYVFIDCIIKAKNENKTREKKTRKMLQRQCDILDRDLPESLNRNDCIFKSSSKCHTYHTCGQIKMLSIIT